MSNAPKRWGRVIVSYLPIMGSVRHYEDDAPSEDDAHDYAALVFRTGYAIVTEEATGDWPAPSVYVPVHRILAVTIVKDGDVRSN